MQYVKHEVHGLRIFILNVCISMCNSYQLLSRFASVFFYVVNVNWFLYASISKCLHKTKQTKWLTLIKKRESIKAKKNIYI